MCSQRFGQLHGGRGRAARGQEIVDDNDAFSFMKCVLMDLQYIAAIFQVVLDSLSSRREFARLAYRHEPRIQTVGDGRPEDEAARFHPEDQIDIFGQVVFGERVDQGLWSTLTVNSSWL